MREAVLATRSEDYVRSPRPQGSRTSYPPIFSVCLSKWPVRQIAKQEHAAASLRSSVQVRENCAFHGRGSLKGKIACFEAVRSQSLLPFPGITKVTPYDSAFSTYSNLMTSSTTERSTGDASGTANLSSYGCLPYNRPNMRPAQLLIMPRYVRALPAAARFSEPGDDRAHIPSAGPTPVVPSSAVSAFSEDLEVCAVGACSRPSTPPDVGAEDGNRSQGRGRRVAPPVFDLPAHDHAAFSSFRHPSLRS